jgi:hypothetical protein
MPARANQPSKDYLDKLELYKRLVATNPEIERKGDTMPYTSVNGNMFSLFTKEAILALRLPPDVREAFLEKHKTKLTQQYGAVMREYVDVPDALLANTKALKPYFDSSYAYAKGLRAKPSRAKKRR